MSNDQLPSDGNQTKNLNYFNLNLSFDPQ